MHAFTSGEVQTHVADMLKDVGVDTIVEAVAHCCIDRAQTQAPSSESYKHWTEAGNELFRLSHSPKIMRASTDAERGVALKEAYIL